MGKKKTQNIETKDVGSIEEIDLGVVLTPDEQAEYDSIESTEDKAAFVKKAVRRSVRQKYSDTVKKFLKDNELSAEDKEAIQFFCGGGTRSGGTRSTFGLNSKLRTGFIENKELSEMDIFKAYKIGRPEVHGHIRQFIKNVKNPDDRIWVSFNEKTEVYSLIGTGAEAPEDWDGYEPAKENVI